MGLRKESQQGCEYWIAKLSTGRLSDNRVDVIRSDLLTMPLGSTMVIDFSDVNFVGSSGLGRLIKLLKLARACKVSIVVVGLQQPIWALFELTKINRILPVHRDIEAWLEELRREVATN